MSKSRWVATDFIANSKRPSGYSAGDIVEFIGWSTSGDGGAAQWVATGNQIAASQTPALLGVSKCSDSSGNEFEIIPTLGVVTQLQVGAFGGGSSDDYPAIQALFSSAATEQYAVYIDYARHLLLNRIVIDRPVKVTSNQNCLMRWSSSVASECGVLLDFQDSVDTLQDMSFPCLYGPAINGSYAIPGYGSGLQDPSTRGGIGVDLLGSNRVNIKIHILNGFEDGVRLRGTATSTCDNVNVEVNTSDFCENFAHFDSTLGNGLAQVVVTANTVWAKRAALINSPTGYINGCRLDITGTSFSNEIGGCGIYSIGSGCRSSEFNINQLQTGYRDDSTLDSPVIINPSSAMSAIPSDGETITQASSGASGVVATNAEYADTNSSPITLINISGVFDTSGELSGSVSGSLGAGSIPSSVRGFVAPLIGGDSTCNGLTYDADPLGLIGYFGGSHCRVNIGMPMDHPSGATDGAYEVFPQAGSTLKVIDNGRHNQITTMFRYATGLNETAPLLLSSTIGEENFNSGLGGAQYGDRIYCQASITALAAGAEANFFIYHTKANDNQTLVPISVTPKNEGAALRELEIIAFTDSTSNNRQVRIKVYNRGASPQSADLFFFLNVG